MSLIRIPSDERRSVDIPGTPGPVRRPVDIDQTQTGFGKLRTLRIYRFDPGSVVDGHAEEDEVFVVVLRGAVELTIRPADASPLGPAAVEAQNPRGESTNAAYLPPGSAYHLVCAGAADVAYARATPSGSRPPHLFGTGEKAGTGAASTVLETGEHAERLRLRLLRISAGGVPLTLQPRSALEKGSDTLVHVQSTSTTSQVRVVDDASAADLALSSWDTLVIPPGKDPELLFPEAWEGFALIVAAI